MSEREQVKQLILKELSKKKYSNSVVRRLVRKSLLTLNECNTITTDKVTKYIKSGNIFKNEYSRGLRHYKAFKKTLKDVKFLERHVYAPEMNKLHTNKAVFSTPQKTSIKEAVIYLVMTEIN